MNGNGHAAEAPMSKQDEDLMQLTLQLRNKKEEEKYAKFHGDKLIGVSERHLSSFAANGPHRIQLFSRLACGKI
jgi:hypothetical protein